LQAEASSLKKRAETLLDTAFNLNAMKPDCLVMRHSAFRRTQFMSRAISTFPVINAGDAPMNILARLLDALTISDRKGNHQQSERYHSWRPSTQPCGTVQYSSARKIWLPFHSLRPFHVGAA